jgi:hypothetical protein
VKITINANLFRDKPIIIELFDTATTIYGQHAKDASLDDRLKEQFVTQENRGKELTMQLWHQKSPHEIEFKLNDGESDRWLIMNMMETGIDVLRHMGEDVKNLTAKAMVFQKIARAEQLREMVEDASGRQ